MVKILIHGDYVDFSAPVYMWEDQFERFVNFLKDLMNEKIEVILTPEKGRTVGNIERHPVRWTAEERFLLLNPALTDEELVKKLEKSKRSPTSIFMQRADFVPRFVSWAREKGYDASKISKTIIEEFMKEKDEDF